MKRLRQLLLIAVCGSACFIGEAQQLTVIVTNVDARKGKVGAALYNSEGNFMKNTFMTQAAAARPGEIELVFSGVPRGDYGISVLHDENDNEKMDSNAVGIPKEGFGFSNDAMGMFGPPGWSKAKITTTGTNQTVRIKLRYY